MMLPFLYRSLLVFLVASLALASLVILPSADRAAPALESVETEIDPTESDDDFHTRGLFPATLFALSAARTWLRSLMLHRLSTAPASPPPKFS